MNLYIDLTELLTNPLRTGIQRVTGELCRYLALGTAIPVRFHGGRLVALPPALVEAVGSYFKEASDSVAEKIRKLGDPSKARLVTVGAGDIVLVPEVFYAPSRVAFFRQMGGNELGHYRFIVYDLIPITHPEFFAPDINFVPVLSYFQIIRQAKECAFISDYARSVFYNRLKRTNTFEGAVLPLGSDSIGPRASKPGLNRPLEFCVLGTIEPRKNPQLILEAFEPLLSSVADMRLNFVGKMGWVDPEFDQRLRNLAADAHSGVRLHFGLTDGEIQNLIEASRATIFVSSVEGYGLPPVESLWLGTPVIASTMIPSLQTVGAKGVHYVDPLSPLELRRSVLAFMDDDYANRKTQETIEIELPTWRSFTEEVLRWCGLTGVC